MVCAALPIFRTIATQWTQISLFEACDKTKSELVAGLSFFLEGGAWPGPSWQWAGSSEHAQVTLCTFLPTWSCHFEGRALGRCTFTPTGCRACTCGLAVRSLALTRRPQEKYEAHFLHLAVVPSCLVPGLPFKFEELEPCGGRVLCNDRRSHSSSCIAEYASRMQAGVKDRCVL